MANKFKFQTWRQDVKHVYSEPGDPIHIEYSGKYDDEGRLVIEPVGKRNIYEYIQSFAESVDINNIVKRFQAGDVDALKKVQGFYFDTTELPDNMADLLNKLNYAESEFEKLPAEFKQKFGNDFSRFICSFDPAQFMELVDNPQFVENVVDNVPSMGHEEKEIANES